MRASTPAPKAEPSSGRAEREQKEKMARPEGETSNAPDCSSQHIDTAQLFEVLADWEHQLTHSDFKQVRETFSKGPRS
jgi:hypothetical protein